MNCFHEYNGVCHSLIDCAIAIYFRSVITRLVFISLNTISNFTFKYSIVFIDYFSIITVFFLTFSVLYTNLCNVSFT